MRECNYMFRIGIFDKYIICKSLDPCEYQMMGNIRNYCKIAFHQEHQKGGLEKIAVTNSFRKENG